MQYTFLFYRMHILDIRVPNQVNGISDTYTNLSPIVHQIVRYTDNIAVIIFTIWEAWRKRKKWDFETVHSMLWIGLKKIARKRLSHSLYSCFEFCHFLMCVFFHFWIALWFLKNLLSCLYPWRFNCCSNRYFSTVKTEESNHFSF